jgi:ABC-type multidrug transport system ATPase subunit
MLITFFVTLVVFFAIDNRTLASAEIDNSFSLHWSDVLVDLKYRNLLNVTSGIAISGRLLGIIGPSGSGKSTFLRFIASRMSKSSLKSTGNVSFVYEQNTMVATVIDKKEIAFVNQEDSFFSMLTVEETLRLAGNLRFKLNANELSLNITENIKDILTSLALLKVSKSLVGNVASESAGGSSGRGISGGERKRLSVACELLGFLLF